MRPKEGNYDNCCRLPSLPASILCLEERVETKTQKKNWNMFFVHGREKGEGIVDEAYLLSPPLLRSLILRYT